MISVLLKNWQLIAIGLLSVALLSLMGYAKYLNSQKETLIAEKNVLQAQLEVSQASVKSLQIAIEEQNAAVAKMKADAEARADAGKVLVEKAKTEALRYKRRADELIKLRPPADKTQCEASEALINEEIRSEK